MQISYIRIFDLNVEQNKTQCLVFNVLIFENLNSVNNTF